MRKTTKLTISISSFAIVAGMAAMWMAKSRTSRAPDQYVPRPPGTLTFARDIAPIVHQHCSGCHRSGQSGPFDLISYADVKKHAQQIAEVTGRRFMPPWLPEPGHGDFVNERRLSAEQIGFLQQWAAEGAAEGDPKDLPAPPRWTEGWQLGPPDLVVTMAQPYLLSAEGKDVYRNFVVPVPLTERRLVRAFEIQPGGKAVHHAFMRVDRARQCRRLDALDPEPGFDGMNTPGTAESPGGFFMSWQPGKLTSAGLRGLNWALEKNCDLVLQVHLQPTGKPEAIQASVGFYFTDEPPTNTPIKIGLSSYAIAIPAGARDYTVRDTFTLPVDVDVLAVLPHAHYLGKELSGVATLPDGTTKPLLLIKDWDFNWQGDYQYARPIFLPKGSTLAMRFTYDNSTNNVRNPNHPPRDVGYGPQTTDEMGELWFQVLPHNRNDLAALQRSYQFKVVEQSIAYSELRLRGNPRDAYSLNQLGKAMTLLGRKGEALEYFRRAVESAPDFDEARYHFGLMLAEHGKISEARAEYEAALRLNPDYFKAHNNLGLIYLQQGQLAEAAAHFQEVLRLNPGDAIASENLERVARAMAPRR